MIDRFHTRFLLLNPQRSQTMPLRTIVLKKWDAERWKKEERRDLVSFPFPEVDAGVYRGGHLFLLFALFVMFT